MKKIILLIIYLFCSINAILAEAALPKLFLFLGGDDAITHQDKLNQACVYGAQIIYSWKQLEPTKGNYNFSKLKKDLELLSSMNKKLFIQIQDRSFEPDVYNVPDYIRQDFIYHGGVALQYDMPGEGKKLSAGWVAKVWDPNVRRRFQLLLYRLANEFDGKIFGVNLPETAIDLDEKDLPPGYTANRYFFAEQETMIMARKFFRASNVVQYVNFFPGEWNNDHQYMSRIFAAAARNGIGLGGPDGLPYKPAHMQNSYPFFNAYKNKLLTAIAIQEPDYTYINPLTQQYYTFNDFYNFVTDYLGAQIIFWNVQEPFFSEKLKKNMSGQYFDCP